MKKKNIFYSTSTLQQFFRQNKLQTFEDFWNCSFGEIVSSGKGREIRRLKISSKKIYLKKRGFDGLWYFCKNFFLRKKTYNICVKEVKIIQILQKNGFSTMIPLAWGEEKLGNYIPLRGFAIFEEVQGENLQDLFQESSFQVRLKIIKSVGHLLGQLHSKGFYDPLRMKDLICTNPKSKLSFLPLVLIDREVDIPSNQKFSLSSSLRGLSRAIYHFFLENNSCTITEKMFFFRHYSFHLCRIMKITKKELFQKSKKNYDRYIQFRFYKNKLKTFRKSFFSGK